MFCLEGLCKLCKRDCNVAPRPTAYTDVLYFFPMLSSSEPPWLLRTGLLWYPMIWFYTSHFICYGIIRRYETMPCDLHWYHILTCGYRNIGASKAPSKGQLRLSMARMIQVLMQAPSDVVVPEISSRHLQSCQTFETCFFTLLYVYKCFSMCHINTLLLQDSLFEQHLGTCGLNCWKSMPPIVENTNDSKSLMHCGLQHTQHCS